MTERRFVDGGVDWLAVREDEVIHEIDRVSAKLDAGGRLDLTIWRRQVLLVHVQSVVVLGPCPPPARRRSAAGPPQAQDSGQGRDRVRRRVIQERGRPVQPR